MIIRTGKEPLVEKFRIAALPRLDGHRLVEDDGGMGLCACGKWHALAAWPESSVEELRDAIDHVEAGVDFQDAINPEAVRVLIAAARRAIPQGEPSDAALDAAFAAFRAHERSEEFNEFGEHVCPECGYAYSWPSGVDGRQEVPARCRQRLVVDCAPND